MLAMDKHVQTMNIEEIRVVAEPTKYWKTSLWKREIREVYQNWNKYGGEDEARPRPVLKEEYQRFCMES